MEHFTLREQVIEVVNKLFIYTDEQEWAKLQSEVFTEQIQFDMSSLGGEPKTAMAKEVCESWQKGFEGLDAVNHLAGNYLVTINELTADVFAYATATHFKKAATQGNTREFVGTYNLHLVYTEKGWRIDAFKYNLKYVNGNVELV
ncbi:nuclear transport factor 2 family protein [Chitinophagaceae bacterium LB-8]|jgi:SnoaL-like protein|uniref:Nuclear transport factor 2 family protein n=1 Tax=Paraflavisolibacter caeni TaxID=2982496 RepID=A0A9X2XVL9_9BACT|nr:nuclear transport factor 2 family protein [Paraflavisolibacter caeni]MCU7549640.1 nuclear transport factor 2 family protein [Paraflavisolibacter caeni]